MAYVLIILAGVYGGYTADHVEFNTLEACKFAASRVQAEWRASMVICVPKG